MAEAYYPAELQKAERELLSRRLRGLESRLGDLIVQREACAEGSDARAVLDGRCRQLTKQIDRIRARHQDGKLVGLALSGGGMRSATFSLGFLQGLAGLNLLREVDILSTVSGGSYIGGFLGALYDRSESRSRGGGQPGPSAAPPASRPVWDVEKQLCDPQSPVVQWLRNNGRYLSPAGASDGWAALAVILRNMVAVNFTLWSLVFTVFLLLNLGRGALLTAAREVGLQGLLDRASVSGPIWWSPSMVLPAVVVPLFLVPLGLAYWLVPERKADLEKWHQRWMALLTNLAILIAAGTMVVGWLEFGWPQRAGSTGVILGGETLLGCLALLIAEAAGEPRHRLSRWLKSWLLVFVLLLLGALLDTAGQTVYRAVLFRPHGRGLVVWIVGAISSLLAVAGGVRTLIGILASKNSNKPKARRGGVSLSLLQMVALAGALVLLLPPIVGLSALSHGIAWGWRQPTVVPSLSSSAASGGPAPGGGSDREGRAAAESAAPQPAGPVTLELEAGGTLRVRTTVKEPPWPSLRDPELDWWWALLAVVIGAVFCLGYGHTYAFLNNSSLASLYAARLSRAYLGASNPERMDPNKQQTATTEMLPSDRVDAATYAPYKNGGPLHIINSTLNETVGGQSHVEERDRKGMNLAFGPAGISVAARHHAVWDVPDDHPNAPRGILRAVAPALPGFRVFPGPGGSAGEPALRFHPEMLDLGRWIAISGAAASTALGAMTSLGFSLLCGLLNVRLGHWWWSGVDPRDRTVRPSRGALGALGKVFSRFLPVHAHLIDECLGRFPGTSSRSWYLTDGGHFENTGVYELIRREVAVIIAIDNGADEDLIFEDVANLVRKARVDFGAEIEFDGQLPGNPVVGDLGGLGFTLETEGAGKTLRYAAVAAVRYASGRLGKLLLVKPGVIGDEALDILHYRARNTAFPQQSTADQFFDEAQWESYRKLGLTCGETLFKDSGDAVRRSLFDQLVG